MTLKSEYEITEQAKEAAYVKRQADKPTGTTTQIKDIFDTYPELIRGKYNSLLDGLDTKFGSYRTSSAQDTIDNGKVDKVQGKGLSEADFTNEEKSKLAEFQWGSVASGSTGLVSGGDVYDAVSPKYQKPSGGIPKTDLSSDVQTTLGKADTALQTHQDITGKVDKVEGKGLSTNDYTNAEKSAVAGISGKADNNAVVHLANAETVTGKKTFSDDININGSKDVVLGSNKANPQKIHYGENDRPVLHVGNSYAGCLVTDSDIETELAGKVDKVSGKGLSTEDYTSAEKTKLSGIEAGAQVNVITSDAASDNKTYGRKNGAWTEITGGGGGSSSWGQITGTLSDQTDLQTALDGKQATLTSGTNIRTVNSTSLLGSGNIFIPALEIISDDATFSEVYAIQQAGKTPVLDSGGEMYFMTGYSPTDYSFTNASFDTATGEYSINLYHLDNDDVWTLTNHTTFPPCTEMPSPAPALWGKTVQYIGSTDANYTHGYFYECVRSGMSSVWQQIDVQPHQSLSSYRTSSEQDVIDATKADKRTIKTVMDAVATANTDYFLGTQSAVAITLPSTPSTGDMISVVFYSGATATTLTVSGSTIGTIPTPSASQRIEMNFVYDGSYWAVLSNVMAVS